jgi:amino acid transporter
MLVFYFAGLRGLAVPSNETSNRRRLFLAWSLIVIPALLIVVLRVIAGAHFDWQSPIYRTIESRSLWHLGFWEWIISAAVFMSLLSAVLFLPEKELGQSLRES